MFESFPACGRASSIRGKLLFSQGFQRGAGFVIMHAAGHRRRGDGGAAFENQREVLLA
jgi:hypothetical protein